MGAIFFGGVGGSIWDIFGRRGAKKWVDDGRGRMCYPHSTKKSWVIMNIVPFQTRTRNVEYLTPHFEAKWGFVFGKV